ncbi:Hachiman antiphage defense system protein HamA [Chryseobacterium sp. BIGb0232]|uniref:Hachiman antiphage defense system protein HamA n=1 Tax=Chryseobacterium sp. BIGb0232 TaxID=2940598 RepID=UPI000F493BCC
MLFCSLSRKQVDELKQADKFNDLVKKAKAKLKHHADNEGELGEILLYCLCMSSKENGLSLRECLLV